jgi:hypothetical protein
MCVAAANLLASFQIFVLSLFAVMLLANNVGFGHLREPAFSDPVKAPPTPFPSQLAGPPMQHDANQAYIWAPISQTPRHIRQGLFGGDLTDTDNSPAEMKALMPPQTPSRRRSPSKGERGRSPNKATRSPSKGY